MRINPTSSITRSATRKAGEKLNILTAPTHERYESGLAQTGHNFYAIQGEHIKDWKEVYAPKPDNYTVLNGKELPPHVDFDLVLSQNKFGQFQQLSELARALHLPILSVEHTLPHPGWGPDYINATQQMRGQLNVFITDYSVEKWQWQDLGDTMVIGHMVDHTIFFPMLHGAYERQNRILTVANDYIGRDWCLDFRRYKRVCLDKGLPVRPVGDTQGLSKPAKDTTELVGEYNSSRIFLNTAHVSPIPTSLLEAMACGCAVVSCNACAIPNYIQHGVNGLLYSNDKEMADNLNLLLNDEELAEKLGRAARQTILEKCSERRFLEQWNTAFEFTVKKGYL
jgi:glycosyltransferase involved in cell wall biosynthesis